MILQALVEYYERKAADPDTALAPPGFEAKDIPFIIVINDNGQYRQLNDTRCGEGKKKRAQTFLVPQGVKKTSGVAANLLWDTAEYVLGVDTRGKPDRVAEQHAAFLERLNELPAGDPAISAIRAFLGNDPIAALQSSPLWPEILESNPLLSFQLSGDNAPIFMRPAIVQTLRHTAPEDDAVLGLCLVSGDTGPIERLHAAIKGVWGAQTSGANIVSFNQRAFESYGKEQKQGENAPVGKQAAFAYTTALNHLLGKDSNQRVQVGDASCVFWAEKPCLLEDDFAAYFKESPKDDPDYNVRAVKNLYQSIQQGHATVSDQNTRFYVLGLAPNAARIAIRFWLHGSVAEFSAHIVQHFDDLTIDHAPYEKPYLPLFRLLTSIAAQGKADNIPPNLGGDTLRSILSGLPYPATLLQAAVRRIRAEQNVPYARAALIKACINRKTRFDHPHDPAYQEELKVSLDLENKHIGYRLGRLFAALEKIQEDAHDRSLNASIRDRFYGAASSTPVTVFPNLMKLSGHHLDKLGKLNEGRRVNMDKWLTKIIGGMDGEQAFPSQLCIEDQGRFAIGYYHQRQAFYSKSTSTESTTGEPA